MTLVNIDPHVIWHRKMHVPLMETFVGRSTWVPAPCALTLSEVAEALLGLTIFRRHEQMVKVCGGLVSQRLLSLLFFVEKKFTSPLGVISFGCSN